MWPILRSLMHPTLLALPVALAGCTLPQQPGDGETEPLAFGPVVVADLGDDLIQVKLSVARPAEVEDVTMIADCNAAAYAVFAGKGFARHLRTNAYIEAGLWRADAVYSITSQRPSGLRPLDAQAVKEDCALNGIPMV